MNALISLESAKLVSPIRQFHLINKNVYCPYVIAGRLFLIQVYVNHANHTKPPQKIEEPVNTLSVIILKR